MPLIHIQRTFWAHRFGWLLGLVLLLPIAQTIASAHLLSHGASSINSEPENKSSLQKERCTLCLTGATLTGGGLLAAPVAAPHVFLPQPAPHRPVYLVRRAASPAIYQSRAPPLLSI